MDEPIIFSTEGQQLVGHLQAVAHSQPATGEKLHVTGVGKGIYRVYERLRNAAEYSEQHLLLRAAIERFLRRSTLRHNETRKVGQDVVVELTHAGYLANDTIALETIAHVDQYIEHYVNFAAQLEATHQVPHEKARRWMLQVLSASLEKILVPSPISDAFTEFAYQHYLAAIDPADFAGTDGQQLSNAVYIAVHRALLKSDIAAVRFAALARLGQADYTPAAFIELCQNIDDQFQGPLANKLTRLVNRNGAPMRVLRAAVVEEATDPVALLANHPGLLNKVRAVADQQYRLMHKRLAEGVMRAIAFVIISKVIIGLSIEVPYDLARAGHIDYLPLLVNLFFPALYMASARLELHTPGIGNTEKIVEFIGRIVYHSDTKMYYRTPKQTQTGGLGTTFNVLYSLTFVVSFGLAIYILHLLHFTVVHMLIFFVFFSAVSFLRFRLLQSARELEILEPHQGFVAAVADFLYTPFVRLGMWLSDKYKKVNIITAVLDFAIELPLKSSLRLLSQWTSFMRDKREEL